MVVSHASWKLHEFFAKKGFLPLNSQVLKLEGCDIDYPRINFDSIVKV